MAESIYKLKFVQGILSRRRKKRVDFVLSKVNTRPGMSILDVGCGPNGRSFADYVPGNYRITGVDILNENTVCNQNKNFIYLKQDAQDLSRFSYKEFDLCVSFGMMEHICNHNTLHRISSEIERVSKQWVIIVPWKYAWIEPHFKFPFFQLLPYSLKVLLTRMLDLHGLRRLVAEDYNYISKHYQWLSSKEWVRYFSGSKIYVTPFMDTIAIVKSNALQY